MPGGPKKPKKTAIDSPGDPNIAHSFIVCQEVENKTAAYLGFDLVSERRHFAVSWPCLRASAAYDKIAKNLGVDDAMTHLNGHESLSGIDDPEEAFPFMENDTNQAKNAVKNKRLAAILRRMEGDITALPGLSEDENVKRQTEAVKKFTAALKDFTQFARLKPAELGELAMPKLHHEAAEEHPLEAINRCWMVLRYMRYAIQDKKFDQKFSEPAISRQKKVELKHTPSWMQPKRAPTSGQPPKSAAVQKADNLPKRSFTIRLDRKLYIPDIEDDLQARYDDVPTEQEPDMVQSLTVDPRLFESTPALRDQILQDILQSLPLSKRPTISPRNLSPSAWIASHMFRNSVTSPRC
ncbi:hypothetical protein KCU92_g4095, partial [Aureobasidium melanogenum]